MAFSWTSRYKSGRRLPRSHKRAYRFIRNCETNWSWRLLVKGGIQSWFGTDVQKLYNVQHPWYHLLQVRWNSRCHELSLDISLLLEPLLTFKISSVAESRSGRTIFRKRNCTRRWKMFLFRHWSKTIFDTNLSKMNRVYSQFVAVKIYLDDLTMIARLMMLVKWDNILSGQMRLS